MNTTELAIARLLGQVGENSVLRINGDVFLRLKDLTLTDDGANFTAVGGYRIPITLAASQPFSKLLAGGGVFSVQLPDAFIKVATTTP